MGTGRFLRAYAAPGAIALATLAMAAGGLTRYGGAPAAAASAGQEPAKAAAKPAEGPSADVQAIRAVDEAFVRDYNKGDAKAVAALFTEDAEVEDDTGEVYNGRAEVEHSLADSFAEDKGAKIALQVDSLRFVTPEVACERGRSVVTPTAGAPMSRLYTVLYVKHDGHWLMSSVREEPDLFVAPHERLKDLAWMVGDWVDEGSDSVVKVHCGWSDDGNFLLRTFTVRREGRPVMTVNQRVGWDPLTRQFRSWEFDSEGGYGEGKWSRDGESWVVHQAGVRPEGTTASATNVLTRVRPDLVRWVSGRRVVGGHTVADEESFVLVRVPPPPGGAVKGPNAPAASPSPETRRPR